MAEDEEKILFLIKFGQKKYLENLLEKGELFFNTPKSFNKIKKNNNEQGDENEGAIWIENLKSVQLTCIHPKIGDIKFKPVRGIPSKLTQFNHNFLTCSFYMITNIDFDGSNTLNIDPRMSEFGEYALIISHPNTLINNVIESANRNNIQLVPSKVEYKNLTIEGRIEVTPFIKKEDHQYQKEFRMVIKNCLDSSMIIKVDKIGCSGKIISSKRLTHLKIEDM